MWARAIVFGNFLEREVKGAPCIIKNHSDVYISKIRRIRDFKKSTSVDCV